eukprot:4931353-Prymnesium_polylepis.1
MDGSNEEFVSGGNLSFNSQLAGTAAAQDMRLFVSYTPPRGSLLDGRNDEVVLNLDTLHIVTDDHKDQFIVLSDKEKKDISLKSFARRDACPEAAAVRVRVARKRRPRPAGGPKSPSPDGGASGKRPKPPSPAPPPLHPPKRGSGVVGESMFTTAGPKACPPPARHAIAGRPSSSIPAWRGRAKRAEKSTLRRMGGTQPCLPVYRATLQSLCGACMRTAAVRPRSFVCGMAAA